MKRVSVVTGTRAEYGLLKATILKIRESPALKLRLIVTGSHLSPNHGLTYKEIESDKIKIDNKIELELTSDTPVSITKSMALAMTGFAEEFEQNPADVLLLLGDRFETFAAATAATIARLPVAHIHGGESTEGVIDEAFRHSITKMSHLHFVSTEEYRKRVIQLGENPDNVHVVGALGVAALAKAELLDRKEIESRLNFRFGRNNLLVTYHPVTLETESAETQILSLLKALDCLQDVHCIFTMPNADTDSRIIAKLVEEYVLKRADRCISIESLGQQLYFSCLEQVDGVLGNSSSGIIEAPSFGKGTINIGDRQKGRIKAASVIDADADTTSILNALGELYSEQFQTSLQNVDNPYDHGDSCEKILDLITGTDFSKLLKKKFHDLN
ncbi:MAG: UDP-N-acetylglucosamine 2-epimerase [Gammaproteobacteria bacterium]